MSDEKVNALQREIFRKIEQKRAKIVRVIDAVEHAKIVRRELKKRFPRLHFRVRTQRFAGGTAVTVYHCGDIPKEQESQVKEFVNQFDGYESDLADGRYNVGFVYEGIRIAGASFCQYNYRWR